MKQLWRSFDKGFLVVLLICILAVWPLLSRASLPEGTDAELHIFRLHELGTLVRGGEFYPRWAPNFYHGYGYPIFNYYAPLTYYLALPLELLPQRRRHGGQQGGARRRDAAGRAGPLRLCA
jgi:uncharacterized membrane protein